MRLIVAHKILISAALLLSLVLLLRGIRLYQHGSPVFELLFGIAFGGVAIVLAAYLRHIWRK
jgi:hypothetical protein